MHSTLKPMLKLPYTQYQWGKWDCFTLANHVRNFIDDGELPDLTNDVYRKYTEESQPKDLVLTLVKKYCELTLIPENGNLVVLEINDVMNLGTYYKGSIIYMGTSSATYQPIERMSQYLHSIWVY